MSDKCPTVCRLVQHCGLSTGDVPSLERIAAGVVMIICWDGLSGSLPVCHCAAPAPAAALLLASSARQAGLGSSPRARRSLRQDPRRLGPAPSRLALHPRHPPPHRIARLECLYPLLLSSRLVRSATPYIASTDALCPRASLARIGARLPGCEASPKHGDTREPATAAAWSIKVNGMAHVVWTRGR